MQLPGYECHFNPTGIEDIAGYHDQIKVLYELFGAHYVQKRAKLADNGLSPTSLKRLM